MKSLAYIIFALLTINFSLSAQGDWEVLNPKASIETPSQIRFISEQKGFILNENELIVTADSGFSWEVQQSVESGVDMAFVGSTGFIVGRRGYVLKTTDGGETWEEVSTADDNHYLKVITLSPDTVYILSEDQLLRSFNGGDSWSALSLPLNSATTMAFSSDLTGHVCSGDGTIIKTTDGGANWSTRLTSNQSSSTFTDIEFVTSSIGYASRGGDKMFKTINDGDTWLELGSTQVTLNAIHFNSVTEGTGVAENGFVLKTVNGGETWEFSTYVGSGYQYGSLYAIDFLNEEEGYAIGLGNLIVKTIDGGSSWQNCSSLYRSVKNISFPSFSVGYASTFDELFRTTNGGDEWTNVIRNSSFGSVGVYHFPSENTGYLIAEGPISSNDINGIYKTTDGGVTWTVSALPGNLIRESFYSIHFVNPDVGYVSGGFNQFSRKIFRTTDGGQNWSAMADISFQKIQFISENTGYGFIGNNGELLKTTDGGVTWANVLSPSNDNNDILDFHFTTPMNGYVVGEDGFHFKTIDGGLTWQNLELPFGTFDLVHFLSPNVGYAFSESMSSKLFRTSDGGNSWSEELSFLGLISINGYQKNIYLGLRLAGGILTRQEEFPSSVSIYDRNIQRLQISPNPAEEIIKLGMPGNSATIEKIQIVDVAGKVISEGKYLLEPNSDRLILKGRYEGWYFITLQLSDGSWWSGRFLTVTN